MTDETIRLPRAQLGKHAMVQAYESPTDYHEEDVDIDDWSLFTAHNHVTEVDRTDTDSRHTPSFDFSDEDFEQLAGVRVEAELTGTVSERVARKTHHHPAEYKNHDVTIRVEAYWFPHPDQLAPYTAISAYQENHPLAEPVPEPEPDPYDL